jgi:Tfp pilus assembly protein PilV
MRKATDRGESLVEVILTIVITSVTVTALIAALSTASTATNMHREHAAADLVLRNYAEATKLAVQSCAVNGTYDVVYTAPAGYTAGGAGGACPSATSAQVVELTATSPSGLRKTLQIGIRTP